MTFHGKTGDRVRLLHMPDDPDPIPVGTEGTVRMITPLQFFGEKEQTQVTISWDNGRSLSCLCPPDRLEVLTTQ